MTNSKQLLLEKLRSQTLENKLLPEVIEGDWIRFEDPLAQFAETLKFVGGSCELLDSAPVSYTHLTLPTSDLV